MITQEEYNKLKNEFVEYCKKLRKAELDDAMRRRRELNTPWPTQRSVSN